MTKLTKAQIADLIREARDNAQASIIEDGISRNRRHYREGLFKRLSDAYKQLKEEIDK